MGDEEMALLVERLASDRPVWLRLKRLVEERRLALAQSFYDTGTSDGMRDEEGRSRLVVNGHESWID